MKILIVCFTLISAFSAHSRCENRHTGEKLMDGAAYSTRSYEVTANYLKKNTIVEVRGKDAQNSFSVVGNKLKIMLADADIVCK
jgi:hypothetical protein